MKYKLILASGSPRRQQLLKAAGFCFEIRTKDTPEVYPDCLPVKDIPEYLSRLKALPFEKELGPDELLITADTIVCIHDKAIGKPGNRDAAIQTLKELSGNKHTVITGMTLLTTQNRKSFSVATDVYFRTLEESEIIYYVDHYRPFDKAGAYGIQEWIGYIGIERIDGSFYNVMGLPIQTLYRELKNFDPI